LHRFNLLIITAASASRFRLIRPINQRSQESDAVNQTWLSRF
jgi:hypothetical protein